MTPDRTFGPGGETVVLQTEKSAKFTLAGTLVQWKDLVAAPAAGNSRLAFAIAASFAGPLLQPLGQESGGFHFKGGSSIGKTSILHAARSTWGCPLGSWRTTDNAAEGMAAGACDTLHLLDEVSQARRGGHECAAWRHAEMDDKLVIFRSLDGYRVRMASFYAYHKTQLLIRR